MNKNISPKWSVIASGLLLLIMLTGGVIYAQTGSGSITVTACEDVNADGTCAVDEVELTGGGVEACLEDSSGTSGGCQAVPASFTDLAADEFTVYLQFIGAAQGYYPTTGPTAVDLTQGGDVEVNLGAVYPVHPKGVAVHEQLNKVYVAFQGPVVFSDVSSAQTESSKPYPFVAVIDGETDEVLKTIPGGSSGFDFDEIGATEEAETLGIGKEPWGVAVSGSGDYVYVGSFADGLISVIDPNTDAVVANIKPDGDFKPTAPAVNPATGLVHFPDYQGGRVIIVDGTAIAASPTIVDPAGFSPFEMVVADDGQEGHNFATLRDAVSPQLYKTASLSGPAGALAFPEVRFADGSTGMPHALGLWQTEGVSEPRLFVTYADDPRTDNIAFPNPNKLLVYGFSTAAPNNLLLRNSNIEVGDYAEVGLVYDPTANVMRGTYAGFAYNDAAGDEAACNNSASGGTYSIDFDGGISAGFTANMVAGSPPYQADDLPWKNPFEIAVNPNNGKIYITDRCWNQFPEGGQAGGGAVLIANSTPTEPQPDPINLIMNGPANADPGETFSVDVVAQSVPEPGIYGAQFNITFDPALVTVANPVPHSDLDFVVINDVDNDTGLIRLVASRQGNVPGLTGNVTLLTFDVTAAETTADATFSFDDPKLGDSQANAFDVVTQDYTVAIGAATPTPEPTDEVTPTPEPTDEVTPTPEPTDEVTSTPEPTDEVTPTPEPTDEVTQTPEPTDEVTPTPEPTDEVTPTPEPTDEVTPTPEPTDEVTPTPEPTDEVTPTPEPTDEVTPTPEPTDEVTPTPEPTDEVTPTPEPTDEVTPTPEPTDEITPTPEPTDEVTPTPEPTDEVTPTPEPTTTPSPTDATLSGQVILSGRVGNDWSGATVTVDDSAQSAVTDAAGTFSMAAVAVGEHTSVTANASGFLSAICTTPVVSAPETVLASVSLLSGDVDDNDAVDITDAAMVGLDFGKTGPDLATDLNGDELVDIFDIILVSINFGETGPIVWTCQ